MIILPLSCTCSDLKVYPKNWISAKVSIKKDWYVYYRFYDPVFKENPTYKKGKLVVIKGMNQFKTIIERQKETQRIIENELEKLSKDVFQYFDFDTSIIPQQKDVFSEHGLLSKPIADELSLTANIPVTYKAGDQPNNALSLNVFQPNEVAASAGTSGIIYGVT